IAFPVVVILGFAAGSALSGSDDPSETTVTLDEGTLDGTDWRVDAVVDIEDDVCAFLYVDDDEVSLNGACTLTPQDVTFGDETVVFGQAGSEATEVSVLLDTGDVVDIPTVEADGIAGRFYVQIVPGDVDAAGLAP
ncbi:MAG: hypothetical protein ACSLFP_06535, partial [Acidimicrobiales bacterium]